MEPLHSLELKMENQHYELIDNIPREILFQMLDNPAESLIVVDRKGCILFMSKIYEQIASMSVSEAIGRHVTEVSPNTRIHKVLTTGKSEIGEPFFLKGKLRIVARVPIKKDGEIIGAYGKLLFWHTAKFNALHDQLSRLKGEIKNYKDEISQIYTSRYSFKNIIGESYLLRMAKDQALQVSNTDSTVLITGESGTGKELFAHSIHQSSKRGAHPFIGVNCSCIPRELAESELFGYEGGSFTGARKKGKLGKFELADKGTLFLDEIGDMPLNVQVKLLRVLQEKQIEKVGGKPKNIDCRIIAATNRNLEELMKEGKFRPDLYYRLNVANIRVPSLREMKSDIPFLVHYFLAKLTQVIPKNITSISSEAMEALTRYSWPGNIRELENLLEGAIIFCKGNQIELDLLPSRFKIEPGLSIILKSLDSDLTLKEQLQILEKKIIERTLRVANNERTTTSKILGIHRSGLQKKIKKYNIQ
jgi:transcriptional regulator with PAS, ATPase and Fis domain